ncbi:zf-BED domain-containing protein [Tanacetum coccineum]
MNSSSASATSSSTHSSANSRKSRRVNAPGARTDVGWEHAIDLGQKMVKCKFCMGEFSGGIYRFKHHLARTHKDARACPMVPEDIKVKFQKLVEQIDLVASKKRRLYSVDEDEQFESDERTNQTDTFVSKKGKNPEFKKMIQMVGDFGRGLDPPSYHEMRVTYLKKEVDYTKALLEDYKKEWKKTGCTLMSDGWSDRKNRSICNFLVNSPKGTIFLASIDTSEISKTKEKVFAMLDDFVEKIGEEHVVQVVTDNGKLIINGLGVKMLMKKRKETILGTLFYTLIDLLLEKTLKRKMKDSISTIATKKNYKFHTETDTSLYVLVEGILLGKELLDGSKS